MKKRFVVLILLIVVIFIGVVWIRENTTRDRIKLKDHSKIDTRAQKMADDYLKQQVGEEEFIKNYAFDPASDKCTVEEYPVGCYMNYEFLPGRVYGGSKYSFFYSTISGKPEISFANNDIPLIFPSCSKDLNGCKFAISLADVKSIARKYNLNDKGFRMVMYENKIVIEASYCNMDTEDNRKKIKIDPVTGQVIWEGNNEECQGIN